MKQFKENIQKHKSIVWVTVIGYIIFNGCFIFPFSNELFPFDYSKGFIVLAGYGILGMCFAGLFDQGKSFAVLGLTLGFTIVGLVCRYLLEYGEVSNTMNFIPSNIALYLIVVPIYCTIVYWSIYQWSNISKE